MAKKEPCTEGILDSAELTDPRTGRKYLVAIENITPIIAQQYLSALSKSRRIRDTHLKRLIATMKLGHWDDINGSTFVFDESGGLMNGQHRCNAVVASGRSLMTLTIRGVPRARYASIDQETAKRSFADILVVEGVPNANAVAGVVAWVYFWQTNHLSLSSGGAAYPDFHTSQTILKRNPSLIDHGCWGNHCYASNVPTIIPGSLMGFLHFLLPQISAEHAESFLDILRMARDSSVTNSPAMLLRIRLRRAKETSQRAVRLGRADILGTVIKSWNMHVQDIHQTSGRSIIWSLDEHFPEICDENGTIVPPGSFVK